MFKKLLQNLQNRQVDRLMQISGSLPNLEPMPASERNPPYLVSRANVNVNSQRYPVETTISIRPHSKEDEDSVEFTTVVGQLRNTEYTSAIIEGLNHRLDGKFITQQTDQIDRVHVIYTSRQPAGWLNPSRIQRELETHARTTVRLSPFLNDLSTRQPPQTEKNTNFPSIRIRAYQIVDTNLETQNYSSSKDEGGPSFKLNRFNEDPK